MPRAWLAFAVALVVWGNVAAWLIGTAVAGGPLGILLGILLIAWVGLWARGQGLTRADVGLEPTSPSRAVALGAVIALAAVAISLTILGTPPLTGEPISYAPLAALSTGELLFRVAVSMPLDTILPEEVAFRGVLLAALLRHHRPSVAIAISSIAFGGWHLSIVATTVGQTNLSSAEMFTALGTVGALAAVVLGGVAFGALRIVSRGLVAPIVAHWLFNSALLLGLRAAP